MADVEKSPPRSTTGYSSTRKGGVVSVCGIGYGVSWEVAGEGFIAESYSGWIIEMW